MVEPRNQIRSGWRWSAALAAGLALMTAAGCSSSSTPPSSKLTKITIYTAKSATASPLWIAQQKGYFKQQGLDVTLKFVVLSGSDIVSVLLGGSAQFVLTGNSSPILAAQKGAAIKVVAMTAAPEVIDLAITNSFAQKKNIPTANATPQDSLAQLDALKGSGVRISSSAKTTDPYIALVYLFKQRGITIGKDVTITPYDNTNLEVAAVKSGKADAISSFPPYTILPSTTTIHLSTIDPLSANAGYYLSTSANLVKQHPQTAQAMVTALAQASQYVKSNPADAKTIVAGQLKQIGITDAPEEQTLFGVYEGTATTFPTKTSFDATANFLRTVEPVSIEYSTFIDPSFATAAYKKLGIAQPADN
jgi:NitT/TauT family transport system substrate-binding protein